MLNVTASGPKLLKRSLSHPLRYLAMSHEPLPIDHPPPNFSDQLWTDFDSVVMTCDNGYKSLNEFVNFLKERIRIERIHCKNLGKLSQKISSKFEVGTLATAMERMKVDVAQSSNERMAFASILETDVLPEIAEMKALYEKMNGKLVQEGKKISKALAEAREKAVDKSESEKESPGKFSGFSALFKPKEVPKIADTMDPKTRLKTVESLYTDVMAGVYEGIQSNEEARIRCLRAALRKYIVFETSFVANRSYDMRDMAETMEKIDHVEVIRQIILSAKSNQAVEPPKQQTQPDHEKEERAKSITKDEQLPPEPSTPPNLPMIDDGKNNC